MADMTLEEAELGQRFAEETDAIALGGAAPDCAEQLAAFQSWFAAECARLHGEQASPEPTVPQGSVVHCR